MEKDQETGLKTTSAPDITHFTIIKPISRGAFGKVFLGHKKNNSKQLYAIKVMRKNEMVNKNMVHQVTNERNALALSNSPFCVHLYYSLQSTHSVYLVMEYMVGGDLKSLLSVCGYFEERMATFYTAEIILALQYLHGHGIIHRDLKPDNMLLSERGHVKLTDFGLSRTGRQKDLEIADLVNCTPSAAGQECMRTPGQLLSLTSHFSFTGTTLCSPGSMSTESNVSTSSTAPAKNLSRVFRDSTNIRRLINSRISEKGSYVGRFGLNLTDKDSPLNRMIFDSKLKSGILLDPELNVSQMSGVIPFHTPDTSIRTENSSSVYHTCSSQCEDSTFGSDSECPLKKTHTFSTNMTSPLSRSRSHSLGNRQPSFRSLKRKRSLIELLTARSPEEGNEMHKQTRVDEDSGIGAGRTGLTQEIQLLELQKSPKQVLEEVKISSPLRSVLKNRNGSPLRNENRAGVLFSTPVSAGRDSEELRKKATRFQLPDSGNVKFHLCDEAVSPISTPRTHSHTPYRTPKSVRRGKAASDNRILGTPDYLAPELLQKQDHGSAVDWWALGVCLFEFMTGIPPFNDETPQAVFKNILARDIPWPEDDEILSEAAQQTIDALLTLDPALRPSGASVQELPLFNAVDWHHLLEQEAPFIPQPDDVTDTCYFQARNVLQNLNVSSCEL